MEVGNFVEMTFPLSSVKWPKRVLLLLLQIQAQHICEGPPRCSRLHLIRQITNSLPGAMEPTSTTPSQIPETYWLIRRLRSWPTAVVPLNLLWVPLLKSFATPRQTPRTAKRLRATWHTNGA